MEMRHVTDDFSLAWEFSHEYLRVEVNGPADSLEISLAYWRRVAELCRTHAVRKLLVVERLGANPTGMQDLPSFLAGLSGLGLEQVRVAFVECSLDQLPTMEHGEILANELGFQGRVFSDEQEAARWLRIGS
jgi:hypothetical protein